MTLCFNWSTDMRNERGRERERDREEGERGRETEVVKGKRWTLCGVLS